MTMTLKQVLQAAAAEIEFLQTKDQLNITDHDRQSRLLRSLQIAIDAHLTHTMQSVDVEKVREVIAELSESDWPALIKAADKLTAALQEKGNG